MPSPQEKPLTDAEIKAAMEKWKRENPSAEAAAGGSQVILPSDLPPVDPEFAKWHDITMLTPKEVETKFKRIPGGHDFLLQMAPDILDKQALLSQLYGKDAVRYMPEQELFIVRKLDKEGKEQFLRTDEKAFTPADIADVFRGAGAMSPEILASIKGWSMAANTGIGTPHTKVGLAVTSLASAAAGEAAGAGKDYLFRKYGIKTDPRTGEILGRRGLNTVVGGVVGGVAGRVLGGGRLSAAQLKSGKELDAHGIKYGVSADDEIAKQGVVAREAMGIEGTAGMSTLKPSTVKVESHGAKMSERIPTAESPMRRTLISQQQGGTKLRGQVTGDLNYPEMGKSVRQSLLAEREASRAASSGMADEAVQEAEKAVQKTLRPTPQGFDPTTDAAVMRDVLSKRSKEAGEEVSAMFRNVESKLDDVGVGTFVEFKNLSQAIGKWRIDHLPKVLKETKKAKSGLVDKSGAPLAQPPAETVRVPVGEFDAADKVARNWMEIAKSPQTLSEAQTMIAELGDLVRMGTSDVGSRGFAKGALAKFYKAAKNDLDESFTSLAKTNPDVDASLSTLWREAGEAHKIKVDALNKSKLVQSLLRSGREGGAEINAREVLAQLWAGKGKTEEIRLLRNILKDDFETVRMSILDDIVASSTIPTTRFTGAPVRLKTGKVAATGEEIEVLNMAELGKRLDSLDDAFLREIFDDPSGKAVVAPLKRSLAEWDKVTNIHGNLGKSSGISGEQADDFLRSLAGGNPSQAFKSMRLALDAEKIRHINFVDDIKQGWRDGDFRAIELNPEGFIDDVVLATNVPVGFSSTIFPRLPAETQEAVRRHTADRLIAKTIDISLTPIEVLKSGKGGVIDPKKFVKELYGTPARMRMIKDMFSKEEQLVLDNFAEVMQAMARYKSIGGSAGSMAVETTLGSGSATRLAQQYGGSKIIFSKPVQKFLSSGVKKPKALEWLSRFYASDPTKPFGSARGTVAALAGQGGIELMRQVHDIEGARFDALIHARGQDREDIIEALGGWPDDRQIPYTDAQIRELMEKSRKGK